jgi:hypothetical protein
VDLRHGDQSDAVEDRNMKFLQWFIPQALLDRRAEQQMDAYFDQKIREARAAKDTEAVQHWEGEWAAAAWHLEREQRLRTQRRLFRKARQLYVPVPKLTMDNSEDGVLMDDSVYQQILPQIRRAQKERQDLRLAWISLITALTGLIGTLVALVALLKK